MSKKKSKHHASQSLSPDVLEAREISFTNLLLLGFEPVEAERRHAIPFNRDMFALPNKKAFEVIMHFLFERLNPAKAHDKFRDCWPICDKKHEQAFRKTVSNQLSEIAAEDPSANLPRIVPSLFMSPGGDRFYSLLMHFSQYVLFKVVKQENGKKDREILQRPKLLPAVSHLGHIMLRTTQAASIRHRRRFLDKAQLMVLLHREWKQFANELVKEHRSLTKQLRDLEHDIRDCLAASYDQAQARGSPVGRRRRSGGMTDGERQMHAVKRTQKIQKVRELWKAVDAFYVGQSAERDVTSSVLQEAENKYRLDAGEINVQVPELLLRECQQELQRRNVGNTYEGGKLSLLTLIQLWNMSLYLYLETIQQAPMPSFEDLSPDLVTQVHTHHAHLANTQAMRSTLTNKLLPELKSSVSRLHKQIQEGKTPSRKDTRRSFQLSSLGLELLPPTPPVSFEPASGSQNETPIRLPAGGTLKNNMSTDTPEAVSMLSDTINKAALRHAGLVQGTPTSTLGELRKQTQGPSKLPRPTGAANSESLPNRKRVKSAPSKVVPSTTPTTRTHLGHPDPQTPHLGTRVPNTHKRGEVNGDMARVPKTQPRNGAGSRLSRQPKDGRKEPRTTETPGVRKASSRAKKLVPDVSTASPSLQRTPVASAKAGAMSSAMRSKTAPRAHQILAEQIADAVTTGGKITPDFLELLRTHSRENSPLDSALADPLAGLDQHAFVSKDKLKRTPVTEERSHIASTRLGDTPKHTMPTRTLFDSDSSPGEPSVLSRDPGKLSPIDGNDLLLLGSREGSPIEDSKDLMSGVVVGNLLDLEEPEQQGGTLLPSGNLLDLADEAEVSAEARSDHWLASLGDGTTLPETRPEFSEDLEQTLAEIFQTRTPQLSTRAKTRIAARKQGSSLSSFQEEDETNSFGTPSLPNRETDLTEGLTPDLNLLRQDRLRRQTESIGFHPRNDPLNFSQPRKNQADVSLNKVRQVSGGSQKSVTFSEQVDEHSFLDQSITNSEQSNVDSPSRDYISPLGTPSDKPGPDESLQTPGNSSSSSPQEIPGKDRGTFLSDVYLAHSPPPPNRPSETLFTSPLEGQLLSDSDLGQDFSMNLSTAIDDLLVPISPDITPSRTPKLTSRHSSANSSQPSVKKTSRLSSTQHTEHSLFMESLPHQRDAFSLKPGTSPLIEDFSNLHLSRMTPVTPNHKSVEMPMNFDLLDEDDSILLPTSPALRQGVLVDISPPH
ncbi:uncharacterized protein LOC119744812 isoform X2 [Patiria miniata]|uniref:HAUS augmin-like complex subunit 6 N-terminal domain-containing protein n=1 Tax=Patiria miniata TaxID=46514 RepID=A0A914BLT5_PATMI|nr:uncharacterized protein LOC119744812 isoform X2 [Patiria miniata]